MHLQLRKNAIEFAVADFLLTFKSFS